MREKPISNVKQTRNDESHFDTVNCLLTSMLSIYLSTPTAGGEFIIPRYIYVKVIVSTGQLIAYTTLQSDVLCVEWDIKTPNSTREGEAFQQGSVLLICWPESLCH